MISASSVDEHSAILPYKLMAINFLVSLLNFLMVFCNLWISLWSKPYAVEVWAKCLQRLTSASSLRSLFESLFISCCDKMRSAKFMSSPLQADADGCCVTQWRWCSGRWDMASPEFPDWVARCSFGNLFFSAISLSEPQVLSLSVVVDVSKQQFAALFEALMSHTSVLGHYKEFKFLSLWP